MKISKLSFVTVLLLSSLAETSANELTANPLTVKSFSVTPGESSELVMYYNTDEQYIGFQFELTLPEGITFAMNPKNETKPAKATVNEELTMTHAVSAAVHDDGLYKAVCVSMENEVISSGAWLLKIPIVVSEDFSGSGVGSIKGCRFAVKENVREDKYIEPDYFDIYVAPTEILLSNSTLELKEGETATLTADYEPAAAAHLPLTWTTSDEAVATVDEQGNVTALVKGKATITVALEENPAVAATCEVNVSIPTGVTSPTAEDSTDILMYDLNGHRKDAGTQPDGSIVIIKTSTGTRKVHLP